MSEPIIKLTPSTLAALMCSRICHDLINPVGMVNTGLEVLDDKSNVEMHEDAIELIRTSSRQANAKLNFLRDAFGAAGSSAGIIPLADTIKKIEDMYKDGKANFIWEMTRDELPKGQARLLMNLVMLAVNAIPRGGDIVISESGENKRIRLKSTGRRAKLDPNIAAALAGKAPEGGFDGRTIQPFYAGMIAREIQCVITAQAEEDSVTFEITPAAS
ncbi:histidine phosphotransferase ChpT [Litorimonas taeanensis]|uniref:Histidine phosphotransferase ChpT n=1 Tax=Litorimonas taeanensis TaxID=568099 RepID=A0A420WDG3_9PROT|nr:histidine phosphotransferase family protein [Litorimonas taeanensis]RKQ69057.1 histidine phosphotransferase ChpT [Litorimonas taeanensis]